MRSLSVVSLARHWAIEEQALDTMTRAMESALSADPGTIGEIRQTLSLARKNVARAPSDTGYHLERGVGIVPFSGVVTKDSTCYGAFFGGDAVTTAAIDAIRAATSDPKVKNGLMVLDTPGGTVDGTQELADTLRWANQVKPWYALVDGTAASAGYWIASQARKLWLNNLTARVGSIGVYAVVPDTSRAMENRGVRIHVVKAGEAKAGGVAGTPVTPEVLAEVQREIDAIYEQFVDNALVTFGRKMSRSAALKLADGRVHVGKDALALGLADDAMDMESVMDEIGEEVSGSTGSPAATPSRFMPGRANNATEESHEQGAERVAHPQAQEEATHMSDPTPPNQAPPAQNDYAASIALILENQKATDKRLEDLAAENKDLKSKLSGTDESVRVLGLDRDVAHVLAIGRGEVGNGPIKIAADDADTAGYVEEITRKKGRAAGLALLGKMPSLGRGSSPSITNAEQRGSRFPQAGTLGGAHRFNPFSDTRMENDQRPEMQEFAAKMEWIGQAEEARGRKFRSSTEGMQAYYAAHPVQKRGA